MLVPAPDPVPTAVAQPDPCDEIAARFRARWTARTGTCATDADCGCYNPVIGEAGCGDVTDGATASALGVIEAEFDAADCDWPHQCGPWVCNPVCAAGRCANRTD